MLISMKTKTMDESKTPPSTSQSSGETSSMETEDGRTPAGTNDTSSRSNMNQNNKTLSKEIGGENEEKRRDKEREICKDGTEARVEKGSKKENINADSSVQKDETAGRPSVPERDVLPLDESAIEKLTGGFLQTFLPQAESSNAVLDELMRNQRVLIETLEQENAKFKENKMMSELAELMTEAKKYHSKLVHLRKEMMSLHEKSTKLKKRALKLQHHRMKQNLQKEQQREREMEQEKHLIAKPTTKKTP